MKPQTGFSRRSSATLSGFLSCVALTIPPASAQQPTTPMLSAPEVTVRVVTVEGVHSLSPRSVVAAAAKVSTGHEGSREILVAVTKAVTDLYRQRGYPVAQVVSAEVSPEGVLRLVVAEGRVRHIVVRGNRKTRTATILEALGTRPGDAYNEDAVRDDRSRLARLGLFNDVTITAQVPGAVDEVPPGMTAAEAAEKKTGSRDTDKNASAGAPASGADTATAPPPSGGEAGAKSGVPAGAVGTAAPTAGGTVQTVPVNPPVVPLNPAEPLPPGEDRVGDIDLVVRVQERQTANIAATVGYSDGTGAVGFVDLSELNLGGSGKRIAAQWQRASNSYVDAGGNVQRGDSRQAFNVSFERPALGLHSTAWSLEVYNQNTVFLPYFSGVNYTIRTFEKRDGATARIGRALNRHVTGYLTARHDTVGYDFYALENSYANADLNTLPDPTLILKANGRVGALGFVLIGDGRDAADNPHQGYLRSLTVEDSSKLLDGSRLFRQATLDVRQYIPLSKSKNGPVFASRLLTGLSSGDVPLPEQYFLGGYELLRGYELYSLYGTKILLGSAELRAPLSTGVQGVAFVDAGNAWQPNARFGSSLKAGAGVGLRFLSPIGPIRFDAAYGDQLRTYVSLGQSF